MDTADFKVDILSKSVIYDTDNGNKWKISNYILRLNYIAVNEWINTYRYDSRDTFETDDEYTTYIAEIENRRKAWEQKIRDAVEFQENKGFRVVQVLAEFFAVNTIERVE